MLNGNMSTAIVLSFTPGHGTGGGGAALAEEAGVEGVVVEGTEVPHGGVKLEEVEAPRVPPRASPEGGGGGGGPQSPWSHTAKILSN